MNKSTISARQADPFTHERPWLTTVRACCHAQKAWNSAKWSLPCPRANCRRVAALASFSAGLVGSTNGSRWARPQETTSMASRQPSSVAMSSVLPSSGSSDSEPRYRPSSVMFCPTEKSKNNQHTRSRRKEGGTSRHQCTSWASRAPICSSRSTAMASSYKRNKEEK